MWPTQPYFVSCELRPPTGWEVWNGADTGLTLRLISSPSVVPYPVIEIQTAQGKWKNQTAKSYSEVYPTGRWRMVHEEKLAFKWQQYSAGLDHVPTRISWSDSSGRQASQKSQILALTAPTPEPGGSTTDRKMPTFTVKKVTLETLRLPVPTPSLPLSKVPPGSKAGLLHQIKVVVQLQDFQPGRSAAVVLPRPWKINLGDTAFPLALAGFTPLDANGQSAVFFKLEERVQPLPRRPSRVTGLLSSGGSWPLTLNLVIPAGLPRTPGLGKITHTAKPAAGR